MAQRYAYAAFIVLGAAIIIIGKVHPPLVEGVRTHAVDTVAPVMDALQRPAVMAGNALAEARSYFSLRAENEKLRAENAQIKDWQNAVSNLQRENRDLRDLLHFKTEPGLAYISARVIADTGGSFARDLIVTAGRLDGVREGMAATTGNGLIGRVIEVGDWSSRVVLLTDLNSRIPVMVAGSGERAILAGDNSPLPRLLFLPQDSTLTAGAPVVTSGHGGIFPPNIPVGTVADNGHGGYYLAPAADLGRIDFVRLVDFGLQGGPVNPIMNKVEAETKGVKP